MRERSEKTTVAIIVVLFILFLNGCSENKTNFNVIGSNVTIWEDDTGAKHIALVCEVSNLRNHSMHFKNSDFDIVDEDGNLIDTIQSVRAYPPIVDSEETAVYYGSKASDKITDTNVKLVAIPHIEVEKSKRRKEIVVNGITGNRKESLIGMITNPSFKSEYKNIEIAIIRRTQSNEAVSVMTAKIDSIKPQEHLEFSAEDAVKGRKIPSDVIITTMQNFAYVLP